MTTSQQDGNMIDKIAQFDLAREIADAEQKKPWPAGLYSKTLFKKHDLRVVLISMQSDVRMKEHHADGTLSLHILKGQIRVSVNGKPHDLPTGTLFTLGASIRHDVEAKSDSVFLLTISWPSNEELAAMKHRGYGS
ncbi:cupin domain-containing protein [Tunturiibacter gelidoferens]|uniref:Quercetin dioxygenase-like cupin family protein n=1 Tax=Tunturiibacter gelidiferens TaxID=3069689 RepID=A0A9X0U3P4_9BACT|nr:cupin domain-containing protein [Edaphobacter lichenicola]MBB5328150.1 quercetin dioxygenase-like cupin family protein [Edaphobacter lichenicola]